MRTHRRLLTRGTMYESFVDLVGRCAGHGCHGPQRTCLAGLKQALKVLEIAGRRKRRLEAPHAVFLLVRHGQKLTERTQNTQSLRRAQLDRRRRRRRQTQALAVCIGRDAQHRKERLQ